MRSGRAREDPVRYRALVTPQHRQELTLLRAARDRIDRRYADPLDVPAIAAGAFMSPAHFSRRFRAAYGETPNAYLTTRRVERACALLRAGAGVTDACTAVGFTSLGSFSSRFKRLLGVTPSQYRAAEHPGVERLPGCTVRSATRVSRIGEAPAIAAA